MTQPRHWSDFPSTLIDLVQKFDEAPLDHQLTLTNISTTDAYSIRNEFHRFRRAVMRAVHDNEADMTVRELYATIRDMSFQMRPGDKPGLHQITYRRQAISRYLDKWEVLPPHVDLKTNQ